MKKLFAKDKRNRKIVKQLELKHFILKQISTNSNFLKTTRWNALHKLSNIPKSSLKGQKLDVQFIICATSNKNLGV